MDVLTFETCWALNNEIIKQLTSRWSLFIQLWYFNGFSLPFAPSNFFVFQWYSMLQNYVGAEVVESRRMECDPLQRPRTSDHQLCLIHPSSQMDRMHRRNSHNSPSLFRLQHILQQELIFRTTKTYITYFQQSVIFVSLHLFNDTLSNSRLYNVIWMNDCKLGQYPEGSRCGMNQWNGQSEYRRPQKNFIYNKVIPAQKTEPEISWIWIRGVNYTAFWGVSSPLCVERLMVS